MPRETSMAAPVSFIRWLCGADLATDPLNLGIVCKNPGIHCVANAVLALLSYKWRALPQPSLWKLHFPTPHRLAVAVQFLQLDTRRQLWVISFEEPVVSS